MQERWAQSLGWEDPLEEGMATQSTILAWRILRQSSLAGYSPQGLTVCRLKRQRSLSSAGDAHSVTHREMALVSG